MRKYDKRICAVLRLIGIIVTPVLKRPILALNICCFNITVLSDRGEI